MYKKYGPKDISGYRYENMIFESVKYADMSAVGFGMLGKKMFMRKIIDGKISLFYHYDNPPTVLVGETFESYYKECAQEHVVYRKGKDGKLKLAGSIVSRKIDQELFEDCPYVKEKLDTDVYSGSSNEKRWLAIEDYNEHCN
jgi:hypothetical protein